MAYQKTSEFTVYSNHMDRLKNGRFEPIMVLLGGQDYLKFKYIELYKKQFHSIYPQGEILNKWSDQLKDASSIYELFSGGGLFSQQKTNNPQESGEYKGQRRPTFSRNIDERRYRSFCRFDA